MTAITRNSPATTGKQRSLPLAGKAAKIALPIADGLRFERIEKICYLEAAGNYTFIHFQDASRLLVCRTLQDLHERLAAPHRFLRIHRSTIINLDYLDSYVRGKGGYVMLEGGTSLPVSCSRKQAFLDDLERFFR